LYQLYNKMEDKNLTHQESLSLITQMINQSKQNMQRGSFYFLFWGFVVLTGYLFHYLLFIYTDYPHPYAIWLITIPAVIVTVFYSKKMERESGFKSHIDYMSGQIWTAIWPPLTAYIFLGFKLGYENITGLILFSAGSAVYLTGKLIKFTPTIVGGIIIWIGAVLAIIFNTEVQYLIGAVTVALGYLVPGYMLRKKEING